MAQMMGVRRTSVTLEAKQLQTMGLIKYRRGTVQILDVAGLEESACECHQAVRNQQAMVLDDAYPPLEPDPQRR